MTERLFCDLRPSLFLFEHPQAGPAAHGFTEKSCSRTFADTTTVTRRFPPVRAPSSPLPGLQASRGHCQLDVEQAGSAGDEAATHSCGRGEWDAALDFLLPAFQVVAQFGQKPVLSS